MITKHGILGYCSNIHPGEVWEDHFKELQSYVPIVKKQVCPNQAFGLGLRIANLASIELTSHPEKLLTFKKWLEKEDLFIFTINGFPYGGFHHDIVKDLVHQPDWTTPDRLEYTKRLATILVKIMPENLQKAGISTSPLSYKFWWNSTEMPEAFHQSTKQIVELALFLNALKIETGKSIHLDLEPEPDGLLGNHQDFIRWYEEDLVVKYPELEGILKEHIQICFDVCHYGVSFDDIELSLNDLKNRGIQIGKLQISSALKVDLQTDFEKRMKALEQYKEPIYLHQVRAKTNQNEIIEFEDLETYLQSSNKDFTEARIHFHVPLFLDNFGDIRSTQEEILKSLQFQKLSKFTEQMEIETYTWGVLPKDYQKPIEDSIAREVQWVLKQLD